MEDQQPKNNSEEKIPDRRDLVALRVYNHQNRLHEVRAANQAGNETEVTIVTSLITAASLLFALTTPLVPEAVEKFGQTEKLFLFMGWVYLLLSVCFGIGHYLVNWKFWEEQTRRNGRRAKVWMEHTYPDEIEFSEMALASKSAQPEVLREASPYISLYLQGTLFIGGLILLTMSLGLYFF